MRRSDVDDLISEIGLVAASTRRRVAGLLFTYRCTIACRHCLFGCRGDGTDLCMTPRQTADYLALLHETGRVVHAAGGEAMMYWEPLAQGLALAHRENHAPHFVETNCSFATTEAIARERLEFFAAHGVRGLYASADPFHQAWVPPERFLLVRRLARQVFGETFFWGSTSPDDHIRELALIGADPDRVRAHVRAHPPLMVGTAQRELSRYLDTFAPDDPNLPLSGWQGKAQARHCLDQFRADAMWELHIDPYGNIQTNCGMILGRVPATTPARILAEGPEHANPMVERVCQGGPWALAEFAEQQHGFRRPERVTQACELCFLTRCHLRPFHPEIFGPNEVYA